MLRKIAVLSSICLGLAVAGLLYQTRPAYAATAQSQCLKNYPIVEGVITNDPDGCKQEQRAIIDQMMAQIDGMPKGSELRISNYSFNLDDKPNNEPVNVLKHLTNAVDRGVNVYFTGRNQPPSDDDEAEEDAQDGHCTKFEKTGDAVQSLVDYAKKHKNLHVLLLDGAGYVVGKDCDVHHAKFMLVSQTVVDGKTYKKLFNDYSGNLTNVAVTGSQNSGALSINRTAIYDYAKTYFDGMTGKKSQRFGCKSDGPFKLCFSPSNQQLSQTADILADMSCIKGQKCVRASIFIYTESQADTYTKPMAALAKQKGDVQAGFKSYHDRTLTVDPIIRQGGHVWKFNSSDEYSHEKTFAAHGKIKYKGKVREFCALDTGGRNWTPSGGDNDESQLLIIAYKGYSPTKDYNFACSQVDKAFQHFDDEKQHYKELKL